MWRGVESPRHHLSAALILFLEVSCRSCWTHPPPFPIYPQPVSSHFAAAKSEEASHPAEYHGSPVSLSFMSACHLHVQHPIPPPSFYSPISFFISPTCFWDGPNMHTDDLQGLTPDSLIQLLSPRLCSIPLVLRLPFFFLFPQHLIAHPAASWLCSHRLRQQQSGWKAWPYLPSRAHSALWDSRGRWRR